MRGFESLRAYHLTFRGMVWIAIPFFVRRARGQPECIRPPAR